MRLRSVPWTALAGLADPLAAACAEVVSGRPAERVLDALLRARREASADQRQAMAEAVFGVGLWRRRLAWHLGFGDASAVDARLLLFSLVADLGGAAREEAARLLGLSSGQIPQPRPPPTDLAHRFSFPDWIAELLTKEAGEEASALADAFNLPGPISFRANRLLTERDELQAELAREGVETTKGRFAPDALTATSARPNIYSLLSYRRGAFEVQDEGSQLLGAVVDAQPGDSVLDYCAGAGGKALQLASHLHDEGVLHVYDLDPKRLVRLEHRASRACITSLRVHRTPPPPGLLVDRVLVDAPCSELGALRRGPDLRFRLQPEPDLPARQLDILEKAAAYARVGGTLVYATCSIATAENEDVARAFLGRHPGFTLAPLPAWVAPELISGGFLRTWPHRHGTDGFFAAVFQRQK